MDPRERRQNAEVAADQGRNEDALRKWEESWSVLGMAQQR
jgi:hypothetical protein